MKTKSNLKATSMFWINKYAILISFLLMTMAYTSFASKVLLVVGNLTLGAGDAAAVIALQALGDTVTTVKDNLSVVGDATSKDLVIISSTVTIANVAGRFKNITQPLMIYESGIYSTNYNITNKNQTGGLTQIAMVPSKASHPMSAGLTGAITVYNATTDAITWGVPGLGATKIATLTTDTTKCAIFAFDIGANMALVASPADPALGRRVGFFYFDIGASIATAQGKQLFNAAVNWAKNGSGSTAPTITTQPTATTTVTAGATISLSVVATGNPVPTYQWKKNGVNVSVGSGMTTANYSITSTTVNDSGNYTCFVSNANGNVTSNIARVNVNAAGTVPVITTEPVNPTIVTVGSTANFSVVATGTATLLYQWQRNGVNISTGTGFATANYTTLATVQSDSGVNIRCIVTNGFGADTSVTAILKVNSAGTIPAITTQPTATTTVTAGATISLSVVATGNPVPTYQWKKNGVNVSVGAGMTTANYSITSTTVSDSGNYTCFVSNANGNVTSNIARVNVNAANVPPIITIQPVSQSVTVGQMAVFTATASGSPPPTFQWKKNGSVIPSAISASYTTPATAITDNGAIFKVFASNLAGTDSSIGATLTVTNPVVLTSDLISISAELSDSTGTPIGLTTPINKDVIVQLFTTKTGGSPIHIETYLAANNQAVAVSNGRFVVRLGEGTSQTKAQDILSLNPTIYAEFLVGDVGNMQTLTPRVPVTSPGYIGAPHVQIGVGVPSAVAQVGTLYQNTSDNSVWIRMASSWIKLSN